MKKFIALGLIVLLFVFVATGCAVAEVKETKCEAIVVDCIKGNFIKNPTYTSLATAALMKKDFSKAALYNNLAQSTGWYEYEVTVSAEGNEIVLNLRNEYKVGETITITRVDTYVDGMLTETTYYK